MLVLVERHAPRAEELDRAMTIPERISSPPMKTIAERMVVRELRPVHIIHYHQRNAGDEQHGSAQLGLTAFYHNAPGQGVLASQILFLSISFSLLIVCISFVNR